MPHTCSKPGNSNASSPTLSWLANPVILGLLFDSGLRNVISTQGSEVDALLDRGDYADESHRHETHEVIDYGERLADVLWLAQGNQHTHHRSLEGADVAGCGRNGHAQVSA